MLNPLNAGTNREEFRAQREKSLGSLARKVGSRTPAYLYPLERAVQWGAAIPVLKQDNHEMQGPQASCAVEDGQGDGAKAATQARAKICLRLQISNHVRDLALFNLAIDNKLCGCDLGAACGKAALISVRGVNGRIITPVQSLLVGLREQAVRIFSQAWCRCGELKRPQQGQSGWYGVA